MNPLLLLLPLGGLALLAFAKGTKAQPKTPKIPVADKDAAKRNYAQRLLRYVNKGGRVNRKIKWYQRRIGAQITGKPDTQTEKRIETLLGYDVTWRPRGKVVKPTVFTRPKTRPRKTTPIKKARSKPGPLEEILSTLAGPKKPAPKKKPSARATAQVQRLPARARKPAKKTQPKTPKQLPATTTRAPRFTAIPAAVPDSVVAATALDSYLRSGGMSRTRVREYQRRAGNLAIDGIPGPKTKARVETLLHRTVSWPANNAAEDLRNYYRDGGRDRTKIKAFQAAMGELAVDGLVGRKTKRRYEQLVGKTW